jgi:2-polyprenyl-3-methyl-5-hydroxy-6-metoxy-1,4-benzoquinol methylase
MLKVYDMYQKHGVDDYYKKYSNDYYNPHQDKIKDLFRKHLQSLISRNDTILDIACGDGLISKIVNEYCYCDYNNIDGTDPFFNNMYATMKLSFEDIAMGKLNKNYNIVICCYAFHLIKDSWKYDFLTQLALVTDTFIIITPSKKITINHNDWKIMKEIREDKISLIIIKTNKNK